MDQDNPNARASIYATHETRELAQRLAADTQIKVGTLVKRLLEWYASMPKEFRLGLLSQDTEVHRHMLQQWVLKEVGQGNLDISNIETSDPNAAFNAMRSLLQQMELTMTAKDRALQTLLKAQKNKKPPA